MAVSKGSFTFYFLMAIIWAYTVYEDYYCGIRFRQAGLAQAPFGGRWKYLTYIDMNIQATYFILCFINIAFKLLFNIKNNHSLFDNFLNFLYTSLLFPIGMVVVIAFWGVYIIDRELVYPKIMDTVMSQFQNHLVHTLPGVGVLIEMYLFDHKYNKCFFKGVLPTLLFASSYVTWVFVVHHYANIWVYPILEVLSAFYRAVFISCLLSLAASLYWLGSFLNKQFWSTKLKIK